MTDKPINWLDILAHVAFAIPAGAMAGAGLQMGLAYGGMPGTVLAVLSSAGGLAAMLYWVLREKFQHQHQWGGFQSNLEWAVPAAMTLVGMVGGWWLSTALL